ncbi:MAG: ZIP family metal transporter [Chloroflexi bacterium]|nr:ZIP family metal transporter [Chloroflexota bacterium]
METTIQPRSETNRVWLWLLVPIVLLIGVISLFVFSNGAGLNVEPAAPVEALQFERTIMRPGVIELHVRNTSPQEIQIAQAIVNDAVWQFTASPSKVLPRMGQAVVTLKYPWTRATVINIALFTSNAVPFRMEIPVAAETATASSGTLLSFTLIGLYVGVIPVFLGMLWFPALRRLGSRWIMFLMAVTAGLLIYLGIDATSEALEIAAELQGPFQGVGLVGIGIVATFLLLDAITRRQVSVGRSEAAQRLTLALMIAIGIGLHNLGEGLAIGAAYNIGAAALGTFLVVGFIIQNITEGLGIIAPVLKDRPSFSSLALMGLIGGAPAIAGAWVGGLSFSQPLAVVFLAIGAGAVFEVVYEIAKLIQKDNAKHPMPLTIFVGVTVGMLMLYVTGLFIK